jgi:conjugal transfer mating pair stabilization protein TraN
MKALLAMLFAMTLAGQAIAGDCQLASSTCVDSSASKTISGIVVTLAQVGGCWEYQDTYTCIKPEAIDYCAALTTAGCGQIGSTCSDTAFNGTCNTYTQDFPVRHRPGRAEQHAALEQQLHAAHRCHRRPRLQQLCAERTLPAGGAYLCRFDAVQA